MLEVGSKYATLSQLGGCPVEKDTPHIMKYPLPTLNLGLGGAHRAVGVVSMEFLAQITVETLLMTCKGPGNFGPIFGRYRFWSTERNQKCIN